MEKNRGFTFIELLVVVAILGVLSALSVGNYTTSLRKSRDAKRKANLGEIKTALVMYRNDFEGFPATGTDDKIAGCNGGDSDCEWGNIWQVTDTGMVYMKILPDDPSAPGAHYHYQQQGGGDDFCLWATLEFTADADIGESQGRCFGCAVGTNDYVICAD